MDAFELWCWRRLLRVPWTTRSSNQSILKEISSEYSLEELMLKLKLQYNGHLMRRADSLEKTLMLGKMEGRRRRGRQRMRWLDGITNSVDMNLSKLWEMDACCGPWGRKELDMTELNYQNITSSVVAFSRLLSFPASGSFPMSQLFTLGGQSTGASRDMNLSKRWKVVEDRGAWRSAVHRITKSWTQLSK